MCITCNGKIVLRTADHFEKLIDVEDCDLDEYKTVVFDRGQSFVRSWTGEPSFTDAIVSLTHIRTYRWYGSMDSEGRRILDEVLVRPEPQEDPRIKAIEALDSKFQNLESPRFQELSKDMHEMQELHDKLQEEVAAKFGLMKSDLKDAI